MIRRLMPLLTGLAFGLVLSGLVPPAQAEESRLVRLSYYGYLGTLQVGQIDLMIEMAPGPRPAKDYDITANITLSPVYAKMVAFQWQGQAHGGANSKSVRPSTYQSQMDLMGMHETMALAYHPNGEVDIHSEPPTVEARVAREQNLGFNTMDPLSAAVAIVDTVLRTGGCDMSLPIFDGARRYNLDFTSVGPDVIEKTLFSTYQGQALHCAATAKLIAGFQPNAISSSFYPNKTDLWLGQAVKDVPLLPVRVLAQSNMGLMRVELVQATTVASATP
ncbi:DUF3108 domain-containing protein [Hypericibacter sp.]|uniref:DUF3108 domain-containing protein n=1 Tax=Hypericibacter sp. TaxID=2705401 RepID=UPI003D6D3E2A